jgi:hypothetical protein
MRIIITLCLCLLSFSCFAAAPSSRILAPTHAIVKTCEQAVPTTDPSFCPSFKSVASCHCYEGGLSGEVCEDMGALYQFMLDYYKSLEEACRDQTDTDYQTCVDDWNCYRNGGANSSGGLCSSTGSACG